MAKNIIDLPIIAFFLYIFLRYSKYNWFAEYLDILTFLLSSSKCNQHADYCIFILNDPKYG